MSGLKVDMAGRLSQFELHHNNQLDPSGTIAAAALVGREEQAVGTDTTAQSQGSAAAVKSSFLTIFRNHIVKKLGKHIFMKHWDIHIEVLLNSNIEKHRLGNILQYDGDWAQGFNIVDKEAV